MVHRPRPDFEPDEEREPDLPLATGPVPKVCSRRNLGGGGFKFGTTYGDEGRSATLPRQTRRSSVVPAIYLMNNLKRIATVRRSCEINASRRVFQNLIYFIFRFAQPQRFKFSDVFFSHFFKAIFGAFEFHRI